MTQSSPSQRPKADWRLLGGTLVTGAFSSAFALALTFAVDTSSDGKNDFGPALGVLVTGTDAAGAHIVSMPLLWLARAFAVLAVISFAVVMISMVKRNHRAMLEQRAKAE